MPFQVNGAPDTQSLPPVQGATFLQGGGSLSPRPCEGIEQPASINGGSNDAALNPAGVESGSGENEKPGRVLCRRLGKSKVEDIVAGVLANGAVKDPNVWVPDGNAVGDGAVMENKPDGTVVSANMPDGKTPDIGKPCWGKGIGSIGAHDCGGALGNVGCGHWSNGALGNGGCLTLFGNHI